MDPRNRAGEIRVAMLLLAAIVLAVGQGPRALESGVAAAVSAAPSPGPVSPLAPTPYRPARGDSIVVFGAHPDDETLGAGGFIHDAVQSGARVTIVTFTNGDGYLRGVDVDFRTLLSTPARFIEFGKRRQGEALAAARQLGVPPSQVLFLGYPDRGLGVLWGSQWDCAQPYMSPYTRRDRSPYPLTFHPGSRYCGEDVLADVETILRRERPAAVVVHHPADTHRDHWAADAFVTFALEHLASQGKPWAARMRALHYLIHDGAWPIPSTYAPDLDLAPPGALQGPRDRWVSFPLTQEDEDAKRAAVLEYRSEVRLLRPYLLSFVRRNEIFDQLAPVFPHAARDGLPPASAPAWDRLPPAISFPTSESLSEMTHGSADMTRIAIAAGPAHLYLGIRFRRPPIRDAKYQVELRFCSPGGRTGRLVLSFVPPRSLQTERRPGDLTLPPGAAARSTGSWILIALPTAGLGDPTSAYLHVLTLSPIWTVVDESPWTLVRLTGAPALVQAPAGHALAGNL